MRYAITEFDPNYKTRKSRAANTNISHSTIKLYNKLIEIVKLLAELSKIQELTDTTVLQASSTSTEPAKSLLLSFVVLLKFVLLYIQNLYMFIIKTPYIYI